MKIYNSLDVEILDVPVTDSSYRYRSLQEISTLTLYFRHTEFVDIPVGSYCSFQGETFTLEDPVNFKKHGERNFEYTLSLESAWARSRRYKIRNIVDGRLKFNLTATPADHLQLVVDNMNLRDSGWSVGMCITGVEKFISYSHVYCQAALSMIADEFDSEWEVNGKEISLRRVEYNKEAPLELSYGRGNGFKPGVGRMNYNGSKPVEVLYVQGGTRNIDFSKYGSHELLLPKSQQLVYEGRTYETDADGLSVTRADKPVVLNSEDSLDLSHIYPSRVGTISSVEIINAEDHFYDILDSSIPVDLDYSQYRTAGEKATIIFQSGILSGREFDIEQTDAALTGYVHAQRRFKIVPQEIDGQTMPNETFSPVVGDKYAVFGIQLPDAYISDDATESGASWDMFREAVKYLYENEDPKFSFTGELDGIWAKQNWLTVGGKIKVGGYVSFSDTQFEPAGVLVRIIGVKDLVNNPYFPVLELSNSVTGRSIVNDLRKIKANEVVTEGLHKEAISFTKRRFRDAQETIRMIEAAFSNFSGSINPVTVQTMALLVGDESLQLRFVDDMATPIQVAHNISFDPGTKVLTSPAGIIQHMTLGISTISSSHAAGEYKFWSVALYESPALAEGDKSYYLYAKVSKSDQTGIFLLSEAAIAIESVAGYYHLLIGILNMENDEGDRSYVDLYGYSEILPGRITTDKITSADGTTFIDLINKVIQGKFSFQAGTSGYENLTDKPDLSPFALEAEVDTIVANLQEQIDGQITTYFDTYVPSLANAPASGWATDLIKDTHLGDLFYNKDTGLGYRFSKTGAVYSWELLKDTDVALALANAATAQDTADGKRRVFTAQPTTPYDLGDLWSQGAAGDLMKCITARASGGYVAGDWDKASKYTDDTAANIAMSSADNANLLAKATGYGKMLYRDPSFIAGYNSTVPYNNEGNGTVTHALTNQIDSPNFGTTGHDLSITYTAGAGGASPGYGGFYFSTPARPNAILVCRFYANIPIGRSVFFASNATGTGSSQHWLTPTLGTGRFEEYISLVKCGYDGVFSTTHFYYINGGGDSTFTWYVSFATVYDLTNSDVPSLDAAIAAALAKATEADYLKEAFANNTTIQGGLLSSTIIRLGAVNQAGTWVEKAGINGAAGTANTPRHYAGGSLAAAVARVAGDVNGAKYVVTDGGKVFAIDVQLAGSFKTAASGERIELDQTSKSVIIYDAANVPKTIITSSVIPSLASLLENSSSSVNAAVQASAGVYSEGSDYDTQYSAILTLPSSGSNYTILIPQIACTCTATDWGEGGEELDRGASSYVSAFLVKPDSSEVFLGGLSAGATGAPGNEYDYQNATIPAQQFSGMTAGDYKIKLTAQAYSANVFASAECDIAIVVPNNTLSGESVVSVSRIFRDGMFLITDASHYHYISPTANIVKNDLIKGFGALAAASVQSNGNLSNCFNSIISNVTAHGGGLYTITHNLGHINYCPLVTVSGDGNYTAMVLNVGINSFQVRTRSAGTGTNLNFYVQIAGS
jgi:hypothetical protein